MADVGGWIRVRTQEADGSRSARDGLLLSGAGLVIGLAGAFALTRFLASQLFGVTATDPATFATVAAVILAVAAVSIVAPARRAALLDPVLTLRSE